MAGDLNCPTGDYIVHKTYSSGVKCVEDLKSWKLSAKDHRGACLYKKA